MMIMITIAIILVMITIIIINNSLKMGIPRKDPAIGVAHVSPTSLHLGILQGLFLRNAVLLVAIGADNDHRQIGFPWSWDTSNLWRFDEFNDGQ